MNKKGLTLIELLAVIVILAVLALIATPIVLNVFDTAREKANMNSVLGLINSAKMYYAESEIDDDKKDDIKNNRNIYDKVTVQGEKPNDGYLYADKNGTIAVAVSFNNKCYKKAFADEDIKIYEESICELEYVGEDTDLPYGNFEVLANPFNENNWAKDNFFVKIKVGDKTSGVANYKWCVSTSSCNPISEVDGDLITSVAITTESVSNQICIIVKDNKGNNSDRICSTVYKLDKTAPVLSGVQNATVNKDSSFDFTSGISANDVLSGISGNYTYSPTTIDTTTLGNKTVIYTVKDNAGNVTNITRIIEVLGGAPTINFTSTGVFNSNNWAKANFYVKANVVDNSNKGIKSFKWCSTTGATCTPTATAENEVTSLVNLESATNKVCVEAIDNNNRVTTLCSSSYKLDKTAPQLSGITDIRVNKGTAINLENGVITTDSLSGINATFNYNPTTVDTNKAGKTVVTYSVSDNAGNTTTATRQVVVDAEAPSITYTPQGNPFNSNGWAKSDFYVKGEVIDNSGTGIKEAKWCMTTSATCTPNTIFTSSTSPLINTESASNRICIAVTDNNNKTTTLCSDTYKLDKTSPTKPVMNMVYADWSVYQGTWSTIPVYVAAQPSNPGPSGSTDANGIFKYQVSTDNVNWVDYAYTATGIYLIDTTGIHNRYFRAVDYAGNTSIVNTQQIKIDKNYPTITAKNTEFTITKGENVNSSTYFTTAFGISSGSVSCNYANTSTLTGGIKTITCTATGGNGLTASASKSINVIDLASETTNYAYTGSVQTYTVSQSGYYKLETWGAQGGYRSSSSYGGMGGYSVGTVYLTAGDKLYIYVGASGNTRGTGTAFNGGGTRPNSSFPGGGDATDIRINSTSAYARMIVAGGGGSDGAANKIGGYGGGLNGETRSDSYGSGGGGASQTAGGSGGNSNNGSFGVGGNGLYNASGYAGAGGGGWYGGGGSYPDGSGDDDRGGGGGSGYVYTSATAVNCPSGCLLTSKYYLADANTYAGNTSFTSPSGSSETGHAGNGYARITKLGKTITNLIKDGDYSNISSWSLSNATQTSSYFYENGYGLKLNAGGVAMSTQSIPAPIYGHKYYGRIMVLSSSAYSVGDARFEWYNADTPGALLTFAQKTIQTTTWTALSSVLTLPNNNHTSKGWIIRNFTVNGSTDLYTDNAIIIDLTEIFGAGNEPSKEWCDKNIPFTNTIMTLKP